MTIALICFELSCLRRDGAFPSFGRIYMLRNKCCSKKKEIADLCSCRCITQTGVRSTNIRVFVKSRAGFPCLLVSRFILPPTNLIGPRDTKVFYESIPLLLEVSFVIRASPRFLCVFSMLGIKRTTVNQAQLNLIPTHSLASQVVNRGSAKQHRELSHFLSDTAVNQVSATGQDMKLVVTV